MTPPTIIRNIQEVHSSPPDVKTLRSLASPKVIQGMISQIASVMAHEVRNPLTNINLSIEMLEPALKDNELKIYLGIIKRSSIRINDLLNELLKYQEEDELRIKKYSIHLLLDDVLAMTEDRLMLKNITVIKNYASVDCKIALNRHKMKIALTNIIINAIDAMAHGKGELRLVTKSIDGRFIIQIEDNGCGISKENLKEIHKPYYTNKPGGLGLGLATTYNILLSNHVGVEVQSEEGIGTKFVLYSKKTLQQFHSIKKNHGV